MLLFVLLACGTPFDRHGGGGIELTFTTTGGEGFSGTVTAAGAASDTELGEDPSEREGFVSQVDSFRDDPLTQQLYAAGTGAGAGLTDDTTGGAYQIDLYGDWLVGATLQAVGAGAAQDSASIRITSADGTDENQYWGTWELADVAVVVDEAAGTLTGPMTILADPPTAEVGATWTQDVTVEWSFDTSVQLTSAASSGGGNGGLVPTF